MPDDVADVDREFLTFLRERLVHGRHDEILRKAHLRQLVPGVEIDTIPPGRRRVAFWELAACATAQLSLGDSNWYQMLLFGGSADDLARLDDEVLVSGLIWYAGHSGDDTRLTDVVALYLQNLVDEVSP